MGLNSRLAKPLTQTGKLGDKEKSEQKFLAFCSNKPSHKAIKPRKKKISSEGLNSRQKQKFMISNGQ